MIDFHVLWISWQKSPSLGPYLLINHRSSYWIWHVCLPPKSTDFQLIFNWSASFSNTFSSTITGWMFRSIKKLSLIFLFNGMTEWVLIIYKEFFFQILIEHFLLKDLPFKEPCICNFGTFCNCKPNTLNNSTVNILLLLFFFKLPCHRRL